MAESIHIASATAEDYDWCARLMASTEPWITLGRDLDACRAALARPGTELFVARDGQQPVGFILMAPFGFAAGLSSGSSKPSKFAETTEPRYTRAW